MFQRGVLELAAPAAVLLLASGLAFLLPSPLETDVDAAWLVHVCGRVNGGETLYRDAFCGTTPLAFVFQSLTMRVASDGLLALRITIHALFAAILILLWATGRMLGVSRTAMACAAALVLIWETPLNGSAYSWWALAFGGAAECGVVWWLTRGGSWRVALLAGILAGLAFSAKPNVGLLVILAVAAVMLWSRRSVRCAGIGVLGFAMVSGACLAGIAAMGAWDWFVEQTITGKPVYVSRASLSYWDYLRSALLWTGGWKGSIYAAVLAFPLLWFRRRDAGVTVIAGVFAVVGLASVYPRPDGAHMILAAPALALMGAVVTESLAPRAAVSALVAVLVVVLGWQWRQVAVAGPGSGALAGQNPAAIERYAPEGRMLVLHPAAPLIYRATRLRNPTRYDYPFVSTFGLTGQQEVMRQIDAGKISAACLRSDAPEWMGMAPELLMKRVRERLRAGPDLGVCRVYLRETQ